MKELIEVNATPEQAQAIANVRRLAEETGLKPSQIIEALQACPPPDADDRGSLDKPSMN